MGYVRQTLALAFLIYSLEYKLKNKQNYSLIMFTFAVFTHVSSMVFAPVYIFQYLEILKPYFQLSYWVL